MSKCSQYLVRLRVVGRRSVSDPVQAGRMVKGVTL